MLPDPALHWQVELDAVTQHVQRRFGVLTPQALNWKPAATVWSVAQNIDHIRIINTTYFPTFMALLRNQYRTPFMGRIPGVAAWMGRTVLAGVHPENRRKSKTFALWQPSASALSPQVLEEFKEQQEELKGYIGRLAGHAQRGVVIASPASQLVVYPLSMAFDIIVAHAQRHVQQAEEVLHQQLTR